MTTYSSRPAGHAELIDSIQPIDVRSGIVVQLAATGREHRRGTASTTNERPEQPMLRWSMTERGLRMNWTAQARAR